MNTKVEFGLYRIGTSASIYSIDFQDASNYVREVSVSRGKSNELDSYDAGTATVRLSNQDRVFDPTFTSPFSDLVRPTGVIRISQDGYVLFTGLISDWNLSYEQSGDSIAEIQASDAFWLFSNLTLDYHQTADSQTSTARMQTILTRPEVNWSLTDTQFSVGKAVLDGTPTAYDVAQGTSVLEYLQLIEKSEVGRLFVGKDGKLVFKTRNDDIFALNYSYQRVNLSSNPSFENDLTGWNSATGTITRNTSVFYVGSASAQLTSLTQAEHFFNAESSSVYTLSVYVRPTVSTATITIKGSQSLSGTTWEDLASATYTVTSNFERIAIQMTTDADFTNGKFTVSTDATGGAYIDAILIEASPVLGDYFDGTIKPADAVIDGITYTYTNAWNL